MARRPAPPPPGTPDASRPCIRCRWFQPAGYWSRLLLGAPHKCHAPQVRGMSIDLVTGRSEARPPADCEPSRWHAGACGPGGRFFEEKADG